MSSSSQNAERIKEAHSTLYDAGLEMRNKVAGKEYVDTALSNATSDFARPMQEVSSEVEIREVILQAAVYAGMPAGMEGTKIAEKTIKEWKQKNGK
ncbi:unnamed protein product [Aureobasidium pullulans]|nr:unnamed protein product [Aureobasidium pullulans]